MVDKKRLRARTVLSSSPPPCIDLSRLEMNSIYLKAGTSVAPAWRVLSAMILSNGWQFIISLERSQLFLIAVTDVGHWATELQGVYMLHAQGASLVCTDVGSVAVFKGYLQGVSLSCTQLILMASPAVWCAAVCQCCYKHDDDKHVSTFSTLHTATFSHTA